MRYDHEQEQAAPQPADCDDCRGGWVALETNNRWRETPCHCAAGEWVMEHCSPWKRMRDDKRTENQIPDQQRFRRIGQDYAAERRKRFRAGDTRYAPKGRFLLHHDERPADDGDLAQYVPAVFDDN